MRRAWTALLLVLAAVVFGSAGYVLSRHDPVPEAGTLPSGPGGAPTTGGSDTLTPSSAALSATPPTSVRTVFLGDDYTLGIGATAPARSWTALLAARLQLSASTVGTRGGGYAKDGAGGKSYLDLVGRVVAAHPRLVVVSGGRNDRTDDAGTLAARTAQLFATLHERLPQAVLVAIAPWWGDSPAPPELDTVAAAVRDGVTAAGGSYLALPDPLLGHPGWMADDADPGDQGYRAIAASVAPRLQTALTT